MNLEPGTAGKAGGRCPWARHELEIAYHDGEWGKPLHGGGALFGLLVLEGMQAGLSWLTVLKKRAHMRAVFDGFDPEIMARYDEAKIARLLEDPGIIRNRAKVRAAVTNARAFLKMEEEPGGFDAFVWSFTGGVPVVNAWEDPSQVPSSTPESDAMSAQLKKRGFKFVGTTICYAFMQSAGMVNDHLVSCPQYRDCRAR